MVNWELALDGIRRAGFPIVVFMVVALVLLRLNPWKRKAFAGDFLLLVFICAAWIGVCGVMHVLSPWDNNKYMNDELAQRLRPYVLSLGYPLSLLLAALAFHPWGCGYAPAFRRYCALASALWVAGMTLCVECSWFLFFEYRYALHDWRSGLAAGILLYGFPGAFCLLYGGHWRWPRRGENAASTASRWRNGALMLFSALLLWGVARPATIQSVIGGLPLLLALFLTRTALPLGGVPSSTETIVASDRE